MGDPAGRQRGLCRQHGRRVGGLSEAARSAASARMPRRNLEAADHRDARSDPCEAGTQGAARLRIRTQWRRQSVQVFAPLEGWRLVKVTHRHTAIDYAHMLRDLSDVHFPDAAKIVLVRDNLNTHKPAAATHSWHGHYWTFSEKICESSGTDRSPPASRQRVSSNVVLKNAR